jgi:hypothetical protein
MKKKVPLYLSDGRVIRRVSLEDGERFVTEKKWKPILHPVSRGVIGFDVVDYEEALERRRNERSG